MAEKNNAELESTEPTEKTGVGIAGGAASLAAGIGAGVATGAALYKTALADVGKKLDSAVQEQESILTAFTEDFIKKYVQNNPRPEVNTPEYKEWQSKYLTAKDAAEVPLIKELAADKDLNNLIQKNRQLTQLGEEAGFFEKGAKVAFNGGAKVTGIVLATAAVAAIATGFLIKKIRNSSSHAERVEQQKAESPGSPSVA